MEDLLSTDIYGDPTKFAEVLGRVVRLLDESERGYVLTGALALDMYVRPRFTEEIDVICHAEDHLQIASSLASSGFAAINSCHRGISGFSTGDTKVRINLCGNDSSENRYALSNPVHQRLFAVSARFPSPLSLLWIFLAGEEYQQRVDAINLIESGLVPVAEIRSLLDCNADSRARLALDQICADIDSGKYAASYSDSVKARILRLQQRNKNQL